MKVRIAFVNLLFAGLLPLGAFAAEPAPPPAGAAPKDAMSAPATTPDVPSLFNELDRNHDSYLSKDEAKRSAEVSRRFNELDVNHDGKIAVAEYKKGIQGK